MLDALLNVLFRCSHKRTTRPVTPFGKGADRPGETYVVCLECGKEFYYDLTKMRIGSPSLRPRLAASCPPRFPSRVRNLGTRHWLPWFRWHGSSANQSRNRRMATPKTD